jgi:hypothetical protein
VAIAICSGLAVRKFFGRMLGPVCVCVAVIITFSGGVAHVLATTFRASAMMCTGMLVRSHETIAARTPPTSNATHFA